jgi:hypothetical protein
MRIAIQFGRYIQASDAADACQKRRRRICRAGSNFQNTPFMREL